MSNKASNPRDGFFMVLNDLIDYYGLALGAYGLTVLIILKRYEGYTTKTCFPSYQKIRRLSGFSRDTISRCIKLNESLELISVTKRRNSSNGNTSNLYRILVPQIPVPEHIIELYPDKFKLQVRESTIRPGIDKSSIYPLSNLLPRSKSDTTQSIKDVDPVDKSDSNKTHEEDECKDTHLTYTKDCESESEFLKPCYQELKKVYPELDNAIFKFLWELALKRKGQNPTKAKKLLGYVIQSLHRKKKGSIRLMLPWLVTAIRKNNWFNPDQLPSSKRNTGFKHSEVKKPIDNKNEKLFVSLFDEPKDLEDEDIEYKGNQSENYLFVNKDDDEEDERNLDL